VSVAGNAGSRAPLQVLRGTSPEGRAAPEQSREIAWLGAVLAVVVLWSGVGPADRRNWVLEVAPIVVGVAVLAATRRRFPLTALCYRAVFVVSVLLAVGGHHMFARVPAGLWLRQVLDLSRNPYDRMVHFATGFAAAIVARELVVRTTSLSRRWSFAVVAAGCLGGAAAYEILEWIVVASGVGASAFLATQGDRWDPQWDMLTTLTGSVAALLLLRGRHDREIERLERSLDKDAAAPPKPAPPPSARPPASPSVLDGRRRAGGAEKEDS
jgi:putative membrane protein